MSNNRPGAVEPWRSYDGVHWSAWHPRTNEQCSKFKFVGAGDRYFGACGPRIYESEDGDNWRLAQIPDSMQFLEGDPDWGLLGSGTDAQDNALYFYSVDGTNWATVSLPAGLNDFVESKRVRTPGGPLFAAALTFSTRGPIGDSRLIQSVNGATWALVDGFAGQCPGDLALAGSTLFVTAGCGTRSEVWLSQDGGKTWVLTLTTKQPIGSIFGYQGRVFVGTADELYVGRQPV